MTDHDPLSEWTRPRTPPALRSPVLEAARRALAERAIEPGVWEQLWGSRALRLGWAASCVALVAGHAALSLWPSPAPAVPPRAILTIDDRSPELREATYLPAVDAGSGLETQDRGPSPRSERDDTDGGRSS
jgi:hypothetical protein